MKFAVLPLALLLPAIAVAQERVDLKTGAHMLYVVPENVEGPLPLVIWLHGSNDTATNMIKHAQLGPGKEWAIIAAVKSINKGGWDDHDDPSINETMSVLKKKFDVDEGNIWMAGFSAGGFWSYGYGIKYPNRIRGIITAGSGKYPKWPFPSSWRLPTFINIGSKDFNLGPSRALKADCERIGLKDLKYNEVPGMGHTIQKQNFIDMYTWMKEIIDRGGSGSVGGKGGFGRGKTKKIKLTVAVPGNAERGTLDEIAERVKEASALLFKLTGGHAWIEAATIRDGSAKGDVVVTKPAGDKRVQLKKKKHLKVTAETTAEEIAFAALHLELGLRPLKDEECLMDLDRLQAGEPVAALCRESLERLQKKLPGASPNLKLKKAPEIEFKIQDKD